jgi:ribosomal protein L11 methyltransferase
MVDAVSNYVTDNIVPGVEHNDTEKPSLIGVKFYVSAEDKENFRPAFNKYLSQIVTKEMPEPPQIQECRIESKDWENSYRDSILPVIIDQEICVRPPWAEAPRAVKYDIIIEPKMAFGTGHHETTRTCLQLIYSRFKKGQRLLDFGCGSGVLAILAGKMGAEYVKGVDFDKLAVDNALENFAINQVNCKFDVSLGSFEMIESDLPYDMVCANLTKPDIITNLNHLLKVLKENGHLILSGILETEEVEIEKQFENYELKIEDFIHENEWLTYSLKK